MTLLNNGQDKNVKI